MDMNTEGIVGTIFIIAGIVVLIANIFIFKERMTFIFTFIILSAGLTLNGISKVLEKLSDIEKRIMK